jgi:PAS domain-containing protein
MARVDDHALHSDPTSFGASRLQQYAPAAADDAIVTVDNGGMITSWNPAAEKLFGYRADTAIGQSLALIIPAKHLPRHVVGFHKAMNSACLTNGSRPARENGAHAVGLPDPSAKPY